MTRIVVCGEALIDLVPSGEPGGTRASLWRALSAGGPMNTAIGLARLGHDVDFLGRLGADAFADQLRSHLAANGVGEEMCVRSDQPTSLAVVSLDDEGKASYTFHFDGTANFGWAASELPELDPSSWLHVASLVTVVGPGDAALLEWVRAGSGGLSLDVNVRPSVLPDPAEYWTRVEPWLQAAGARSGLVKGSDEDFAFVAGPAGLPEHPDALVTELRDRYGLGQVVLTRGPDGATACDAHGVLHVPSRKVALVDTIGAGDTFMAGLLSAFVVSGKPLAEAVRRGAEAAALVCEREGADPPTAAELDAACR